MTPIILDLAEWAWQVGIVSGVVQPPFEDALIVVGPDGQGKLARTPEDAARMIKAILTNLYPPTFNIDVASRLLGPLHAALRAEFPDHEGPLVPILH